MSTAEAEIATRAVLEITELREQAVAAYVAMTQGGDYPAANAIEQTADAIESADAGAHVLEFVDSLAAPVVEVKPPLVIEPKGKQVTMEDAVTALQAAVSKGVQLPTVVEFLREHGAKKVIELQANVLPLFIEYLDGKVKEVQGNG